MKTFACLMVAALGVASAMAACSGDETQDTSASEATGTSSGVATGSSTSTSTSTSSTSGSGGSGATGATGPGGGGAGQGGGGAGQGGGGAGQGGAGQGGGGAGQGGAGQGGGGSGQGGGGGQADLVPSLTDMEFFVDCMPIVSADPINGNFHAHYDNTAGAVAGTATITNAKLVLTQGVLTEDWTFTTQPPSSGSVAAGATQDVTHQKVAASGMGSGNLSPCSFCGGTWSLEVTWDVGGSSVQATFPPNPGAVMCAF